MAFLPPLVQTRGRATCSSYRCKRGRSVDDNEYLLFLSARFRENGQTAMAYVHAKVLVASFAKVIQWLAMSKRMFLIVSPFLAIVAIGLLLSACSGSSVHVTAKNATLVSIGVTPANPNLPQGLTGQFTATGTYSDNSTQDLTAQVAWSSSNTGVATIGSASVATRSGAGTTRITATLGRVSGSTTLTVTDATLSTIAVTPTNPSIANGTTRQFTATGTYSDSTTQDLTTQVAWSSSAAGVATISNASGSKGLATSVAAGTTTITATLGGVSGSTTRSEERRVGTESRGGGSPSGI